MGIIVTLLPRADRLRRLQAAVRGRHQIAPCGDWGELRLACGSQPVTMAVFDLHSGGSLTLEPVRQLRRLYPRLITVAYVTPPTPERVRDLFDAGRAGIDGMVVAELDDTPDRFAELLELAEARSVAGIVRSVFAGAPPLVRDALLVAVTRAHDRLSPDILARAVSLGRAGLSKRLADAGFPPPRRLITWARLIVAGQLLEDPLRSADAVSLALDFPSGSAFRNSCQRYLGATPSQVRDRGGADFVIRQLVAFTTRATVPGG